MSNPIRFVACVVACVVAFLVVSLVVACATIGNPRDDAPFPSPGATAMRAFRDCRDCPEMMALPAGRFVIGSPSGEIGPDGPPALQEGPQRVVSIAAFAICVRPVTRAEWATFVAQTGRPTRGGCAWSALPGNARRDGANEAAAWNHLGFEQADDHPAVCIGWNDAQDYVAWLGRRTGQRYRLPSESEWEYAARAGTTTAYPWGDAPRRDRANYGADRCCSGFADADDRWTWTSPVGAFPANGFGLFDLHGNAMQWVQDCVSDSYASLPLDGTADERDVPLHLSDPAFRSLEGRSSCAYRILRGGNWGDPPSMIRSASRNFGPPPGATLADYASAGGGFRVARSIDR